MDHPHANYLGLADAVDVLHRPNVLRQRAYIWTHLYCIVT
jgi:hypothetical protein